VGYRFRVDIDRKVLAVTGKGLFACEKQQWKRKFL
jgi:hypothetical protein